MLLACQQTCHRRSSCGGTRRHPSQVYETIAALAILLAVVPGISTLQFRTPGLRFLAFCVFSAGARLFLEAFRGDSQLLPNGLRVAQIEAWMALAGCLWGIWRLKRQRLVNNE